MRILKILICFLMLISPLTSAVVASQVITSPADLLKANCVSCHASDANGLLSRISGQRKTPEGWEMTINRMRTIHGLVLHGAESEGRVLQKLVKYLTDTQGLSPEETTEFRYLIEQDLNHFEDSLDDDLTQMCGRCHSVARFALQRRTRDEWNNLVHFHLGQYPSTEYSAMGRDRDWFRLATESVVPELLKQFPFDTQHWAEWQAVSRPGLSGRWVMTGYMPGKGQLHAVMEVQESEPDNYKLTINGSYSSGEVFNGSGKSILYTGHEWRGQIKIGDVVYLQAFTSGNDGVRLIGRMYKEEQRLEGMNITAIREEGDAEIISVYPAHIKQGTATEIRITGRGLQGEVKLASGLTLGEIVQQEAHLLDMRISAKNELAPGYYSISIGDTTLENAIAVYDKIDGLQIVPGYSIARIGGDGGSRRPLNAVFHANGIAFGGDGMAGTDDDIRLGPVEQVSWHVEPWDAAAEADNDEKFAGSINPETGVFLPAPAGPNPERKRSTNNAGNLKVIAALTENNRIVTGAAQLLVTVQIWVDTPLK